MSANDLQQSLLSSIELLSQNAVNQDNAVKSIKATIVAVKDEGLNTYTVSYGGNEFEASATNTNIKYQSGDIVYILIPDGDFSQKKLIIGAVTARATMYSSNESSNPYIGVSTNLFNEIGDINLKSWVDEVIPIRIDNFGSTLSEYLKQYKTLKFSAKIKTNIDKDHQVRGNYGLILKLPFNAAGEGGQIQDTEKIMVMDVNSIPGNPYAFTVEQQVDLYFDIDETWNYDLSRVPELTAFVSDFGYVSPREIDADIFIKDVSIQVLDSIPESANDGYYLSLVSSNGNFFLPEELNISKTLTPKLRLNGFETSIDDWECYWFVEDSSIKSNSDGYHALGSLGWKCLNDKTNISYDGTGKQSYQYVLNKYSYQVKSQDVVGSLRYKCVLVQNDVVLSAIIEIKNLSSQIEISLIPTYGDTVFPEGTGNVNLTARIYYPNVTDINNSAISIVTEWQRFDKDGNYLDNDFYSRVRVNDPVNINDIYGNIKRVWDSEIKYSCSDLDQLNLITCTFYSVTTENGSTIKKNLGTANISVTTSDNLTYRMLISNGDIIYKYDADGDSPLVANYDGPATSKIKDIIPISFRMFKEDGIELSEEDYRFCKYIYQVPKNSMISLLSGETIEREDDNYYYIEGYGKKDLGYNISAVFNKKKTDNTILLTLEYAGNVTKDSAHIKFIKDGESGTNGTKYTAVITYQDFAYGEKDENGNLRKLQLVYINGAGWKVYDIPNNRLIDFNQAIPQLNVKVYKDGVLANNSGFSIVWNMFDTIDSWENNKNSFNINTGTGVLSVKEGWVDETIIYTNIVEVKVTPLQGTDADHYEELYAYYPIEVTRVKNNSYINTLVPTLDGGFSEVLYASDGTNPAYDNSSSFVCTNNLLDNVNNYYTYTWTGSSNLQIPSNISGKEINIKPVSRYDSGISKNFVKATIQMNVSQQTAFNNLINETNAEISDINKEIAYYEAEQQRVDNLKNFRYNSYISNLQNSQLLLLYINDGVEIFKDLKDLGEDIIEYCGRSEVQAVLQINLINIINSYFNNINTELNALHNLIKGGSLNSLSGLTNSVINISEDQVNDISIYYQIKAMTDRWNQLIQTKYNNVYVALTRKTSGVYNFQSQVDNLTINLYNALTNFVNTTLVPLGTAVDGRQPDQEFINLKNNLTSIVNRINSLEINSYSDIEEKILFAIDNLLTIYYDDDYQNNYYDTILDQFNTQLEELVTERNGYTQGELPSTIDTIIHVKPIIMTYNRYEMSNLNGWDGNKLYIDANNEQYLLAPQIGAGKKNLNNTFTGIVMGDKKATGNTSNTETGLFGYNEGQQTIFLDAKTGNATFGGNDNRIEVTPTKAEIHMNNTNGKIYSGSHSSLNSTDNGFYLSSDGLSIGSNFKVTNNGTINATAGTFTGTLDGATLIAPQGHIGGFEIGNVYIRTSDSSVDIRSDLKQIILQNDDGDKLTISRGNITLYNNSSRLGSFMNASHGDSYNGLGIACDSGRFLGLGYYTGSNSYHAVLRVNDSAWFTWSEKLICYDDLRMATGENIYFSPSDNSSTSLSYIGPTSSGNGIRLNVGERFIITTPNNALAQSNYLMTVNKNSSGNSAYFYGDVNVAGTLYYNSSEVAKKSEVDSAVSTANSAYSTASSASSTASSAYDLAYSAARSTNNVSSGSGTLTEDTYSGNSFIVRDEFAISNGTLKYKCLKLKISTSDKRLKTNVREMPDYTKVYMKLHPMMFNYHSDLKWYDSWDHYNVMAQDFENACIEEGIDLSNSAIIRKRKPEDEDNETKYIQDGKLVLFNQNELHAIHIQMIQKQQKEINKLNQDIIYLKGELDILKQQMEVKGC